MAGRPPAAPRPGPRGSFWGRLWRSLSGGAEPEPAPAPPQPAAPPLAAPPAPDGPPAAPASAFEPFAKALGVSLPAAPVPLPEELEREEAALCARVLEHCQKHKLGPASSPALSLRILNLVASPDAEVAELARVISADTALSASVLNVANSSYYRGFSEIETIRDAVARLGLDEVGRVAGALSAKSLFNPKLKQELQAYGPVYQALYKRAVTVATAAAALALRSPGARSDRAYLGGMLHDVGRTVALRALASLPPEERRGLAAGDPRLERVVDRVHVEIGADVHQEWKLPAYLTVLAVRHHEAGIPAGAEFVDLHVVRLTAAVHDVRHDPGAAWRASQEILESAAALGLDVNGVRAVAGDLRQAEERMASTFFGLDGSPGAPPRRPRP